MSFYYQHTLSKIAVLAYLISILIYSPSALSGGAKEKNWKGHHANGKMSIPENIRREGREKLLNPRTDLKANMNKNVPPVTYKPYGQQLLTKPVAPGYGSPGMGPGATQLRMQTRQLDHPEKPPVKEMEKEASHHAHHQHEPCDTKNNKQGCQEYTPAEKSLIDNKLMGK